MTDHERLYALMCQVKLTDLTPTEAAAIVAVLAPAAKRAQPPRVIQLVRR